MQRRGGAGRDEALPSLFSIYLRTGRRMVPLASANSDPLELKFNPYHDPGNGQFTFAPGGSAHAAPSPKGQSTGAKRSVSARMNLGDPANYTLHTVGSGDTLSKIASRRKGLTAADLAVFNNIPVDATLKIGQQIKLPTQDSRDAARGARNRLLALDLYMRTHDGKLPPDVAHPPSINQQINTVVRTVTRNGYSFDLDLAERTRTAQGVLHFSPAQGRSRTNQTNAGKPERLLGDEGGHYIARRFGGPSDAFNHFAQDGKFNRGRYRALENEWADELSRGHKVYVRITPAYDGFSVRPSTIYVFFTVDGVAFSRKFPNANGGR